MNTDMQNDIDNVFLCKSQSTIDQDLEKLNLIKLGNLMPFLIPVLTYILIVQVLFAMFFRAIAPTWFLPQIKQFEAIWVVKHIESVINERTALNLKEKQHPIDLLQLMLDSSTHDDIKVKFGFLFVLNFILPAFSSSHRIIPMMTQKKPKSYIMMK
jgi:hypothetical protein